MADTNLPPGPELDALVAYAMYGPPETMFIRPGGNPVLLFRAPDYSLVVVCEESEWQGWPAFKPSTTGNGMLAMHNHIREKYVVKTDAYPNGESFCMLYLGGLLYADAMGGTLPHAVALALLAAAKAEKEKP